MKNTVNRDSELLLKSYVTRGGDIILQQGYSEAFTRQKFTEESIAELVKVLFANMYTKCANRLSLEEM